MSGPSRIRRFITKTCTIVGAVTCSLMVVLLVSLMFQCASRERVTEQTVLELDLEHPLAESRVGDPLAQLLGRDRMTLHEMIGAIDRASQDDRVAGLVANLGGARHGIAQTQELRDAISRFRSEGKFAWAFSETFGELSPGNQSYYLATAFDEVWLQPTGALGLTGLMSESMFVKGTLELLGVQPQGDRRREYKNAFNMFTERRYTEAHREATQRMIDDMFGQMVRAIAERRSLSEDHVRKLIDGGPYLGAEAARVGLVDGVAYRDEVFDKAKARAGEDAKLLYARAYRERLDEPTPGGRKIALVYGIGGVARGENSFNPLSGEQSMGSDTVAGALRAAIDDDDVAAIVFRVDSPGGSAVASDVIWREVVRAKEAGKPVIVSMGNVAGSGGYYMAAAATKIVAQPGTVTGSIGVLAGKAVTRTMWNKVGVTWDSVQTSANADMFSNMHEYDEAEWARLQAWLDWVYVDFKQKVADGRSMSLEQVEEVARGRIWSGERAQTLGLVDELGGLHTALQLAKREAEFDEDRDVAVEVFPRPKAWWQELLEDPPSSSEDHGRAAASEIATGLERWRPIAARMSAMGLGAQDAGVLTMTPMEISP